MNMNIIVCLKQIPDPEAPLQRYRIDETGRRMETEQGIVPVVNPFDENAIEAALRLKETHGGKVTVLTLGDTASQEALKRALRMGADDAILVEREGVMDPAPHVTAYLLAKAIEKIGSYDLVICGRQAGDWDQGQVGCLTAECLNVPCLTIVKSIEMMGDGKLRVQRLAEGGYEVMEASTPALVTVTNEINQPRLTTVAGVLRSSKYKIPVWSREDVGADPDLMKSLAALTRMENLYIPETNVECQVMSGETPEEQGASLIQVLRNQKII